MAIIARSKVLAFISVLRQTTYLRKAKEHEDLGSTQKSDEQIGAENVRRRAVNCFKRKGGRPIGYVQLWGKGGDRRKPDVNE